MDFLFAGGRIHSVKA